MPGLLMEGDSRAVKPLMAATATGATDEQLVAAIRDGSDEALEALFLRYKDRIAAYVRGIVPDQGKAEDIVQETFISALRSLRSSRRPIAFRPWIYQIARNACIDQLRRQKRTQEVSIDSDAFNPQRRGPHLAGRTPALTARYRSARTCTRFSRPSAACPRRSTRRWS